MPARLVAIRSPRRLSEQNFCAAKPKGTGPGASSWPGLTRPSTPFLGVVAWVAKTRMPSPTLGLSYTMQVTESFSDRVDLLIVNLPEWDVMLAKPRHRSGDNKG
jgi:hypothetical protein